MSTSMSSTSVIVGGGGDGGVGTMVVAAGGGVKTVKLRCGFGGGVEATVMRTVVSAAFDAGGAEESGVASMGSSTVGFFATGGVEGWASGRRLRLLAEAAGG